MRAEEPELPAAASDQSTGSSAQLSLPPSAGSASSAKDPVAAHGAAAAAAAGERKTGRRSTGRARKKKPGRGSGGLVADSTRQAVAKEEETRRELDELQAKVKQHELEKQAEVRRQRVQLEKLQRVIGTPSGGGGSNSSPGDDLPADISPEARFEALTSLAQGARYGSRFAEAVRLYQHALDLQCGNPAHIHAVRINMGLALESLGEVS